MSDELLTDDVPFEALYQTFTARLRLMARKRGIPPSDAEDLVQETFARAFQGVNRGELRDSAKIAAWLYGIFNNVVSDYWRKRGDRERLLPPGDPASMHTVAAAANDPDLRQSVVYALRQLPKRHRFVLLLNARDGLTAREIAPILGRAEGTVGEILASAKRQFREHFSKGLQGNVEPKRLQKGERRAQRD